MTVVSIVHECTIPTRAERAVGSISGGVEPGVKEEVTLSLLKYEKDLTK